MPAKTPSPMPAPPVKKIQRGTTATPQRRTGATPPRRKKRRNPVIWFLQGLARRLDSGC